MTKAFFEQIETFNSMYRLESHAKPTLLPVQRIKQFYEILKEEVEEGLELVEKYQSYQVQNHAASGEQNPQAERQSTEILTDMADWLGDIIVYCASEARRWGLPLEKVLDVIMQSNFSKLDAQGQPIYDHRGKVLKGPAYWRPEDRIKELLLSLESKSQQTEG